MLIQLAASDERTAFLSLAEAVERLATPFAMDAFSSLTGAPLLVVDVRGRPPSLSRRKLARAQAALMRLPCPTVALGPATAIPPLAAELLDAFDLVLGRDDELAAVQAGVARAPLAALMLVQLLRMSAQLDVHHGLVAESLAYGTLLAGAEHLAWLAARPTPEAREPNPEPAVLSSRVGPRLELKLNRPEKRNAYSAEMRDALVAALELALAEPSIYEVEISGEGASFCAGGDLDEFGTHPDLATAHAIRSTRSAARSIAMCSDAVTVRVHGACVGAGVELPAFAGRVVARRDAWFRLPELSMGLIPGAGGTVSLPRRIGRQRTCFMALTGVRVDTPTALAWGLIDEIAKA